MFDDHDYDGNYVNSIIDLIARDQTVVPIKGL